MKDANCLFISTEEYYKITIKNGELNTNQPPVFLY